MDLVKLIAEAMQMQKGLGGDANEAANQIFSQRAELGAGPEQNELAAKSRFFQGQQLQEAAGTIPAMIANAVYEADKGASQALGRDRRMLPITDAGQWGQPGKFDETTSPASMANVFAAQAGITEKSPVLKWIADQIR